MPATPRTPPALARRRHAGPGPRLRRPAAWAVFRLALPGILLATTVRVAAAAPPDEAWARISVPAEIHGGDRLVLQVGIAPPGVEEYELLLSLDDGRTFPVRVTREIEAGENGFEAGEHEIEWRVPKLAAAAARIRVRYRFEDREINGPASAPFAILTRGEPAELRLWHECGWWEGLEPPAGVAARELAGGRVPVLAGADGEHVLEDQATPPSGAAPRGRGRAPEAADCPRPRPGAFLATASTRSTPLRN